eukprot:Gb_36589 [translate_table: standard]
MEGEVLEDAYLVAFPRSEDMTLVAPIPEEREVWRSGAASYLELDLRLLSQDQLSPAVLERGALSECLGRLLCLFPDRPELPRWFLRGIHRAEGGPRLSLKRPLRLGEAGGLGFASPPVLPFSRRPS